MWDSWNKVCESKEVGGMGMIEIRRFNITLLGKGKWIWRFGV